MSVIINSNFSAVDFNNLDDLAKRDLYRKANETHQVGVVRQLNGLGMKPKVPNFSGPTIISNFMDIATKYDTIQGFLKELRQTNRLLTEKEFQPLSTKKWVEKGTMLGRILGCDHLMQKIAEKQLAHIKVPLKVAVIEDLEILKMIGFDSKGGLYEIHSDQVKIYAERIERVDRKLSLEEIDELIQVIEATNFIDLCPANIVVAEKGVYFIDTEFKSFAGSIEWGKMGRFQSLIEEKDKGYFRKKIEEKMNTPIPWKKNNEYDHLKCNLRLFNNVYKKHDDDGLKSEIGKLKKKISKLEYVGIKEAGNHGLRPNHFSFNLRDVLA